MKMINENTKRLSRIGGLNDLDIVERVIYILKCGDFFKIGFALNIKQRLYLYRVHNPFEVLILSAKKTTKFREFESYVFGKFASKLKHGEWFQFNEKEIEDIQTQWFSSL